MSRIWDSLKSVERRQTVGGSGDSPQSEPAFTERRCSERLRVCVPLFVYGHSIHREPFYEAAELLFVNAMGGLITLETPVTPGQKLLLTSQKNQRDQECSVIGLRSDYLNRFAMGVAFEDPLPDFWSTAE
ncbi:MAG: hypothetical protein WB460_03330 [Candidatus Acidiferrales bacterium]